MALSKRTVNKHNIKRAEVFKANGLNNLDIMYAHPQFIGYGDGTCTLCGQKHLKWLFSIKFDAPGGLVALAKVGAGIDREGEVTLLPIGSKCITDWLDAIPETPEKLEALKRWEREMSRCKQAMKAKVVEDLCSQFGFDTPQDAYEAYLGVCRDYSRMRSVLTYYEINRLSRNANKVRYKKGARTTVKTWLEDLQKVLAAPATQTTAAPAPPTGPTSLAQACAYALPTLSIADQDVLDRGDKVFPQNKGRLNSYGQRAFEDIAKKVRKKGRFVSTAQRKYFTDMLKKLEA